MISWKALETLIGGVVIAINHSLLLKSKRSMDEKKYLCFICGLAFSFSADAEILKQRDQKNSKCCARSE